MAWSNVFAVFEILMKVAPLVKGLMFMVEDSGAAGEVKKATVTEIAKAAVSTAKDVSTGGAKESWTELEKPLSAMIDLFATMFFGSKETVEVDWFDEDHAN